MNRLDRVWCCACEHAGQIVVLCMWSGCTGFDVVYVAGKRGCGFVFVNRPDRVWCCACE